MIDKIDVAFDYKKTFDIQLSKGLLTEEDKPVLLPLLKLEKSFFDQRINNEYRQLAFLAMVKIHRLKKEISVEDFKTDFDTAYKFVLTPLRHFSHIYVEHHFLTMFVTNYCNKTL